MKTPDLDPVTRTIKRKLTANGTGKVMASDGTSRDANTPTRSELDRDLSEAAQEVLPPGDLCYRNGEAERGVAGEQGSKCDLPLGTG